MQSQMQLSNKFNSPQNQYEERLIQSKGHYDMTMINNEDVDIYEDTFEEVIPATQNKQELSEVVDNYKRILSG